MCNREYDFFQIKITAILTIQSLLHCGDGDTIEAITWQSSKRKEEGNINTVCKDKAGKPYIPASTLRGSLRGSTQHKLDKILFGASHENGAAGKIRIYDAIAVTLPSTSEDQYQHSTNKTTLIDGVAIDPITKTAKAHNLYIHEVVPKNTEFEFTLEADKITKEELEALKEKLGSWNASLKSAIGKGRSKGWGKLEISSTACLQKLTKDSIKHLVENNELVWDEEEITLKVSPQTKEVKCTIRPNAPLLINDHARIIDTRNLSQEEKSKTPNQVFMREGNKAIIPGSSIKGLVRAHAHKIMATIAHLHYGSKYRDASSIVENEINNLFGAKSQRSKIWYQNAKDTANNVKTPHTQYFNAIDRFTGGVLEGALFSVEAADCDELELIINYDENNLDLTSDWWKGLLLLVIRDFMQDGFSIGWGKAKGYGFSYLDKIEIMGETYTSMDEIITKCNEGVPDKWVKSLHQKIKCVIESHQQEGVAR